MTERTDTPVTRINTPFTNEHFAAYCLRMVGQPYWFGTAGYKCSKSLLTSKRNKYPNHYLEKNEGIYQDGIKKKLVCADCIGGCKGYAWTGGGQAILDAIGTDKSISSSYGSHGCPDKGANSMFTYAKSKGCVWGTIDTLPDVVGLALYKDGHAGYYVGDGFAVEWKGTTYGCVKSAVKGRGWTHWYMLPFIDYGDIIVKQPTDAEPQLVEPQLGSRLLINGSQGQDVKTMQELLMQLGYDMGSYGADGKFGAVTEKAVKAFQKKVGIKQDGIYGTDTHTALMSAIAERDDGLSEDSGMEDDKDSGKEDAGKDHAGEVESIPAETQRLVLITAPHGNINIRYGNGTNFERITSVPPGTKLPYIAAAENGWIAVLVNGIVGWVHPEYILKNIHFVE